MQQITNLPPAIMQNTVTDMRILRMLLQPTGTYKAQHYRPLVMELNNQAVQSLSDQVDQAHGRISDVNFDHFAAQTLRPSGHTLGQVDIPNGWGTERFSFELTVMVRTTVGEMEERLIGWSERRDQTFNGLVDPDMYFVVNSVTRRRVATVTNGSGTFNNFVTQDAAQIFFEPQFDNQYNTETTPKLIRPYDIYGRLAVDNLDPSASWVKEFGMGGAGGPGTMLDTRGSLTGAPMTSRRSNSLNGNYLQRTVDAYSGANLAQQSGASDHSYADFGQVFSTARKDPGIREIPVSESDFLQRLCGMRMGGVVQPMFTLKELYQLDPVLAQSSDQRMSINDQSLITNNFSASNWNDTTEEAIAAAYLAQSIPAILSRVGAFGVSVYLQNENVSDPTVRIMGHTEMMLHMVPVVEKAIETELMPTLTVFNTRFISMTYSAASIYQNATISISINGKPKEIFDVPQFADARFSPIISNEMGAKNMTSMLGATLQRIGVPTSTDFSGHTPMDLSKYMEANTAAQNPVHVEVQGFNNSPQPNFNMPGGFNNPAGFGDFNYNPNNDSRLI